MRGSNVLNKKAANNCGLLNFGYGRGGLGSCFTGGFGFALG